MLWKRRWVLESYICETDFIPELEFSLSEFFLISDFGNSINYFKNKLSQGLSRDNCLDVGKGGNEPDEACDQSDDGGDDVLLVVWRVSLGVILVPLDKVGPDI